MMVVSDLPEDLVEEIMCRVPATSLKRLRSTCKRWNRLFHDKRFTKKHLKKAAKQFLVLMLREDYKICSMSVNLHHEIPSIEVTHELSLNDSHSNSAQTNISSVFQCDGLLLCTLREHTRIVVWNPFTGQTKWIHHRNSYKPSESYTLGSYSYQDNNISGYKILCYSSYGGENREFEIYEINSNNNSWRILEVTPYCNLVYISSGVSLKGKTYWFSVDTKQMHVGMFLVSFDYTREKFGRLCLPRQCLFASYEVVALSVVREEKLSVLLQHASTSSKTEIWVTNKIDDDETKVVSWSKVLTVDYYPKPVFLPINLSFLVDEEKKVLLCCENNFYAKDVVYIVGDDNKVTQVNFGASTFGESTIGSCGPVILSYVPSLIQIEQGGGKRKRGD